MNSTVFRSYLTYLAPITIYAFEKGNKLRPTENVQGLDNFNGSYRDIQFQD